MPKFDRKSWQTIWSEGQVKLDFLINNDTSARLFQLIGIIIRFSQYCSLDSKIDRLNKKLQMIVQLRSLGLILEICRCISIASRRKSINCFRQQYKWKTWLFWMGYLKLTKKSPPIGHGPWLRTRLIFRVFDRLPNYYTVVGSEGHLD